MQGKERVEVGQVIAAVFTKRWMYHTVFWLVILGIFVWIEGLENGVWVAVSNELLNLSFYAVIVYFNLFYLIPNFLRKKKFLSYLALLIFSVIVITPLRVIFLYFKYANLPDVQFELVQNQNLYFLSTFLITGSSTLLSIVTDWARGLKEKQVLEKETMQSELKFLKSQINPHFLFNTLNNLYALTLKKSDKAPEIVLKLSEMMRYMLYECNEKQVLLSKEIHYMRNYIDLEKLRQSKNVDISFEVDGDISHQKIAPLLFITFLENSFKHGLNNNITEGFMRVKFEVHEKRVIFTVENSKPDNLSQYHHNRPGGIGLVNVRRRLDLLYSGKYDLKINETPSVYSVSLNIITD